MDKLEGQLAYHYIRGSQLHNLATETSDTDYGGVYFAPIEDILGLNYKEQYQDNKGDICYYEFGRWFQLLGTSNPSVLESLFVPDHLIKGDVHPVIRKVLDNREKFITQQAFNPLIGYAYQQLSKAKGLNKKINWDETEMKRKDVLDFCYMSVNYGSMPVKEWLEAHNYKQERIGCVAVSHMPGMYALFYDWSDGKNPEMRYKGIVKEDSNEIRCSSVPKGEEHIGLMYFNDDEYSRHCRKYKEYLEWKEKRNPVRYENNRGHNYDAKNMCHTVRLLNMGLELATTGQFNVVRTEDRDFLLAIKHHEYPYEEILKYATDRKNEMEEAMRTSTLPKTIDKEWLNRFLIECRKEYYGIY